MISLNKIMKYKKLMLIGAVLLIIGAVYRFYPQSRVATDEDSLNRKMNQLTKYQQLIDGEKKMQARLAESKQLLSDVRKLIILADTPALAAVKMQDRINQISSNQKIAIESMRFLEPVTIESAELKEYLEIPLQFSIDAPIRQVKSLLYELENSDELFVIREIRARVKTQGDEYKVSITLIVCGYMKAPEK